jgi:3-hydroxyisobutyrate dehydrogenase
MPELRPGESRVSFVGLGAMGRPMSARLAGHFPLTVHDKDPEAMERWDGAELPGVEVAADLGAAARGASAVVLMLPDSAAVEEVFPTLLEVLEPGTVVVDMSSSDPVSTRELYCRTHAAGIGLVDAPVSGGVVGARAGSLTAMIGGQDDDVAAIEPLLACLTGARFRVGGPGAGHAVKALNNLLSAAGIAIASEALAIGSRFGVDAERMIEVFNSSSGRSWATEYKFPEFILPGRFTSGFRLDLQRKDVATALDLAATCHVAAPVADATAAAWTAAAANLDADADHTEFARHLDLRRAG